MMGIYKITSPSGKVYIGQSVDIERRLESYKQGQVKTQTKLLHSFEKYGFSLHSFEIIEDCIEKDLNTRERYWQDFYNVLNEGLNCRLTESYDKSGHLSSEVKQKISLTKKGVILSEQHKVALKKPKQFKNGNPKKGKTFEELYGEEKANELKSKASVYNTGKSPGNKGKVYEEYLGVERTNELKAEMRKRNIGKTLAQETKRKIAEKLKKKIIAEGLEFTSLAEAAAYFQCSYSTIINRLKNKNFNYNYL
jgi:group I intron endonuclease